MYAKSARWLSCLVLPRLVPRTGGSGGPVVLLVCPWRPFDLIKFRSNGDILRRGALLFQSIECAAPNLLGQQEVARSDRPLMRSIDRFDSATCF